MIINDSVLSKSEITGFRLRELFSERGYLKKNITHFDDYSIYADNLAFIGGSDVVSFTDNGGVMKALRPDVTLSIAHSINPASVSKLYYHESVFRRAGLSREFRELSQCGIEFYAPKLSAADITGVIELAIDALTVCGSGGIIDIAHTGITAALLSGNSPEMQNVYNVYLQKKNTQGAGAYSAALELCAKYYGGIAEFAEKLRALNPGAEAEAALSEMEKTVIAVKQNRPDAVINVDFSLNQDVKYYSGIVFQGILPDYPTPVLSGGRYEALMHRIGKNCNAIGFAITGGLND